MKIKMLETVRPDFPFIFALGADTVLYRGEIYNAIQSKHGAVCGICENGEKLGVKPGEFEIVQENRNGNM